MVYPSLFLTRECQCPWFFGLSHLSEAVCQTNGNPGKSYSGAVLNLESNLEEINIFLTLSTPIFKYGVFLLLLMLSVL